MSEGRFDLLIVGSGPGGANAAVAAVERGISVAVVDVGNVDTTYAPLIPDVPFSTLRSSDAHQKRYFLGISGRRRYNPATGSA